MTANETVVIVGSGHAGSQVAASLRQEGFEGPVVLVGEEPDLPYHRPPLSKAFIKDTAMEAQVLRAESFYRDQRIELELGRRIRRIDRGFGLVEFEDGRRLRYGRLVLATGTRPRIPDIDGVARRNVLTLRTLADAKAVRAAVNGTSSAVVIGGGFIGLEIAFTLAALGKAVTVLEAAVRILGRSVAPAVSAHVMERARQHGVRIVTEAEVEAVEGEAERASAVRIAGNVRIAADLVVLGTGVLPYVELARDAALRCENGIAVNGYMETSDPRILAIGDCASYRHWQSGLYVRLESVQNATDHARHAAKTLVGAPQPYREVPWFWSDQGDIRLQTAGLSHGTDRYVVAGETAANAFSVFHFAGPRLVAIDSVNRPADHLLGRKMLSVGFSPRDEDILAGAAGLKEAFSEFLSRRDLKVG